MLLGQRARDAFLPFSLLLAVMALVCQTQAQSAAQLFQGKVFDPAGAPIAGASIAATPEGGAYGPSTLSNETGEFSLLLEPGNYAVNIAAEGFEQSRQTVRVPTDGRASLTVMLQIAAIRNTVTVVAADYRVASVNSATKTLTPLRDVPQSITVVTREQIRDQLLSSIGDVVRYVPGVTAHQGENNRDQIVIRGVSSSADFFLNGVRDDVQYYRDLYNLERIEFLKGPNAMVFGRGGGGGVINRVTKEAGFAPFRELTLQGGSYNNKRVALDFNQPFNRQIGVPTERRLRKLWELPRLCEHGTLWRQPYLSHRARKTDKGHARL